MIDMPGGVMETLAQIVALTPDRRNVKTVVAMGPVEERLAECEKLKKSGAWPERKKRPLLEVWDASGAVVPSAVAEGGDKGKGKA